MNIFFVFLILGVIFLGYKKISFKKTKNIKLDNFKNKLQSTQTNINRKSNIHRARLSKFKKSKLNGEMIFQDDEQRIYKFNNGKKVYL